MVKPLENFFLVPLFALVISFRAEAQTQQQQSDTIGQLQQQTLEDQRQARSEWQRVYKHNELIVLSTIQIMERQQILFSDMRSISRSVLESDVLASGEPGSALLPWPYLFKGRHGELVEFSLSMTDPDEVVLSFAPAGGDHIIVSFGPGSSTTECSFSLTISSGSYIGNPIDIDCNSFLQNEYDTQVGAAISNAVIADLKSQQSSSR